MKIIFPTPKSITSSDREVSIGRLTECGFKLILDGSGEVFDSAVERLSSALSLQLGIAPPFDGAYPITLKLDSSDIVLSPYGNEAYRISITDDGALLVGASERAVYYAALTLLKLVEVNGERAYLPISEILDYPDFKQRGMFAECRYNDFMTLDDWKCAVDTVADLKMNTLKIGLYGTWSMQYDMRLTQYAYIPFKSHPEIRALKNERYFSPKQGGWVNIPDRLPTIYEEDFFGDIVAYGKRKGVEVIPLINSLGHNSLIPEVIPSISAKDEEGNLTGYGLCTSNPETYKVYFDLYDEIIDRYLAPNGVTSFAIGLDEVGDQRGVDKTNLAKIFSAHCKCEKCRSIEPVDRMVEYMIKLLKHLKARGMKNIYVYYDMFFYHYGIMNETLRDILIREDVYDVTVIDWWNYGADVDFFRGKADEVNGLFRSVVKPMAGYWGWEFLSDNTENMAECSTLAKKHDFEGIISYSNFDPRFEKNHVFLAESAWNAVESKNDYIANFEKIFFKSKYPDNPDKALLAWQAIYKYLHPYNYKENPPSRSFFNQYTYSYLITEGDYPRDHFAWIFRKMDENPGYYLSFVDDFNRRATEALAFFAGDDAIPSEFNTRLSVDLDVMRIDLTEAASLYRLRKSSLEGELSNHALISELERLIRRRKRAMYKMESIQLHSLAIQTLRIMSICLEYLEELLERVRSADSEGKLFLYDSEHILDRTAPIFKFLR